MGFIDPWAHRETSGYQITEALISIGSGVFQGLAWEAERSSFTFCLSPTLTFIFAIWAEETGFIGAVVLIALFTCITLRGWWLSRRLDDAFDKCLAVGLTALIGLPAMFNLYVALGMVPTKGLALPFISAGLSHFLASLIALGILLKLSTKRVTPRCRQGDCMKVIIAGGGTGGHLFPGIAVAQELKRRSGDHQILFVGSPRGIEKDAVPKAGFKVELLPVSGLRRMGLVGTVKSLLKLPVAIFKAFGLVLRFRPSVAVSVGGYAAGPAVLAARLLGVHVVVMEQNAVAGTTNRILGKMAHRVVASLYRLRDCLNQRLRVLGNPVRIEMNTVRSEGFGVHQPLRVLVFGGSQGARAINNTVVEMLESFPELKGKIEVFHQTGRLDFESISSRYEKWVFLNTVAKRL